MIVIIKELSSHSFTLTQRRRRIAKGSSPKAQLHMPFIVNKCTTQYHLSLHFLDYNRDSLIIKLIIYRLLEGVTL
jgi:hypothetical protein